MLPSYGTSTEIFESFERTTSSQHQPQPKRQTLAFLSLLIFVIVATVAAASWFNHAGSSTSGYLLNQAQKSTYAFGIRESTANKPNFIAIVADDMSMNSIGYEPYDLPIATPFLTGLSAHGIRNLKYYGQEVCTPSRAALLTGMHSLTSVIIMNEQNDSL